MSHLAEVVLEDVERAVMLSLRRHLPAALIEIADEWVAKDAAYFAELGQDVSQETPLVAPVLYFTGHHPSALDRDPRSEFPNLTVMCYQGASSGELETDQTDDVRMIAYAEVMLVDQDEDRINRTAKRYTQAMQRVAMRFDPDLDGVARPFEALPEVATSNVSARRYSQYTDEVWYVQGARIDYVIHVLEPW